MRTFKAILGCVCVMATCSVILSTAGCKVQPALERSKRDTTYKEKIVYLKDTTFKGNKNSVVHDTIKLPCPDANTKPQTKKSGDATLKTEVKGGVLFINCECDTPAVKATLRKEMEREYRGHTESEKETITIREKYIPDWVLFFAWSGGIFWLIYLIKAILKVYNPFKTLLK